MRNFVLAAAAAMFIPSVAQAAPCNVTFGGSFSGAYTCNSLGTPTAVTGRLGGVTFLDNSTLLIGGNANEGGGYIASIGVTRDAANHIIGFSGPSTTYASAPFIDGGLTFGPNGVLFATGYPNNTILQFKPGSTAPDRVDAANGNLASLGSLLFVPTGFAGAGGLKLLSYNNGNFSDATLTPDGTGTFAIASGTPAATLSGGPEGAVYVSGANAGFGGFNSLLVAEYGAGSVGAYRIDANGNPIVATRQTFLSGLSGAEGALIDSLTGDFLFSTFGSGNQLFVIQGFVAPPQPDAVPEPASWAMMLFGFGALGLAMRRRPRAVRVAAA